MKKREIRLRSVDRWVIGLLATILVASGVYLAGPWYMVQPNGSTGPVLYLVQSVWTVHAIGVAEILTGFILFATVTRDRLMNTAFLANALLAAFLIRLFTLYGTLFTLKEWLPPSYISAIATVAMSGVYWIWVRRHEGTV